MTGNIAQGVRLLAETISSGAVKVADPTHQIIANALTFIVVLLTLGSLRYNIIQNRRLRQQTEDLERQRAEQEVFREDVLSTSLRVYSKDKFANCHLEHNGPNGILKVYSLNSGKTWLYQIINVNMMFEPSGELWEIDERVIHNSSDNRIHEKKRKKGPTEFNSKRSCIEFAILFHQLDNPIIELKDNSELQWYKAPPITADNIRLE